MCYSELNGHSVRETWRRSNAGAHRDKGGVWTVECSGVEWSGRPE